MNQEEALTRLEKALEHLPDGAIPGGYRNMLDWQWIVLAVGGEENLLSIARKWQKFDSDWRTETKLAPPAEIIRGWLCGALGDFFDLSLKRAKAKGLLVMEPNRRPEQQGGINGISQS